MMKLLLYAVNIGGYVASVTLAHSLSAIIVSAFALAFFFLNEITLGGDP